MAPGGADAKVAHQGSGDIAGIAQVIVWPLIRYSYDTHNLDLPTPAPSKPTWMLTEAECRSVVN